ncbi:MAG: IS4 family transposase [Bacteroidales bacterium]|nr:IS4 family transposase [Bacteroidales bacterium]
MKKINLSCKNNQKFFSPLPVFGQLASFVKQANIEQIIQVSASDKHYKKFKSKDHILTMLVAVITRVQSIRDLCAMFLAHRSIIHHFGIYTLPKRSTLSYVNKRRHYSVFEKIYHRLYQNYRYDILDSTRRPIISGKKRIAIDSTIVGLVDSLFRNVGRYRLDGKRKGGIKLHCTLEEGSRVPQVHYISQAIEHDQGGWQQMSLQKGDIYVMDRGYLNYTKFLAMNEEGIYFVRRMKDNSVYKSIEEKDVPDKSEAGILKDEIIEKHLDEGKKIALRRVAYWDDVHQRLFVFITNLLEIEVDYIPLLYKSRWEIEIVFRQMKQNFQLRYFLGDNENAIRIQIWCCLIANLLITVLHNNIKKRNKRL